MTELHVPVDAVTINSRKCQGLWKLSEKFVDFGRYGSFWEACCDDDCKYVAKIVPNRVQVLEDLEDEIKFQEIASYLKIAPKIEYAWIDPERDGGFIMEAPDITLSKLTEYVQDRRDWLEIFDVLYTMIDKLSELGIKHNFITSENIMASYPEDIELSEATVDDLQALYFIDYSKSEETSIDDAYEKNREQLDGVKRQIETML